MSVDFYLSKILLNGLQGNEGYNDVIECSTALAKVSEFQNV